MLLLEVDPSYVKLIVSNEWLFEKTFVQKFNLDFGTFDSLLSL